MRDQSSKARSHGSSRKNSGPDNVKQPKEADRKSSDSGGKSSRRRGGQARRGAGASARGPSKASQQGREDRSGSKTRSGPQQKSGSSTESGSDRSARKKLFKRKRKRAGASPSEDAPKRRNERARSSSRSGTRSDYSGRRRKINRSQQERRRARRNRGEEKPAYSIVDDIEQEYRKPDSVFVYTHVIRPNPAGGQDYRAESLPTPTRKIEDFGIDLSKIVGTILEVDPENLPLFEWNWQPEEDNEEQDSKPE